MMDVKVVKRGNSLALSLPSSAGFKRGEAFLLISDEKGGYLFGHYLVMLILYPIKFVVRLSLRRFILWMSLNKATEKSILLKE